MQPQLHGPHQPWLGKPLHSESNPSSTKTTNNENLVETLTSKLYHCLFNNVVERLEDLVKKD